MSKICLIGNNAGGMYGFRRDLILALKDKGNQLIILVPSEDETDIRAKKVYELGVEVIHTGIARRSMNPIKDMGLISQYRSILKKVKPDLVITYTIKPNIYAGFVCRTLKIPFVANITGLGTAFQKKGMLQTMVSIMYKHTISKAKVVFFENSENRDVFVKKKLLKQEKTHVLNGAGVNTDDFRYVEYPADGVTIRFLFIGRIMKEKGVDELLGAMKRLVEEGCSVSLDFVGRYEEDYKEQIVKYEEEGWLTYHGVVEDVRPFIADSHCFVLPSWHEGMANTNLESASTGRPVITSNIPGCKEAVLDGVSGFLTECRSIDSLYETIKRMSVLSNEERRQMGIQGRKHMEAVFDKQKVVEDTIRHL